jgi:ketosteroid isomerase-like protein
MSLEENKRLATEFFAQLSENDLAAALDTLTDDATWWLAGKPEMLAAAGLYSKEKITRLLRGMAGQLKNGLTLTVKGLIAEGDKVAVEVESVGELQNGRIYNQQYHFLLTIRDGRISAVKEYLDTQHVFATWLQP